MTPKIQWLGGNWCVILEDADSVTIIAEFEHEGDAEVYLLTCDPAEFAAEPAPLTIN
jgi:hypothetical protein